MRFLKAARNRLKNLLTSKGSTSDSGEYLTHLKMTKLNFRNTLLECAKLIQIFLLDVDPKLYTSVLERRWLFFWNSDQRMQAIDHADLLQAPAGAID
jgi:hypothetical protein